MDKAQKTGLEGLFQGIASILRTVNDVAVRAGDDGTTPIEVQRSSSFGVPGALNTVYGASVRVGPRVAPPRTRPRTLRQNARREPVIDDAREPIADVFDEGDHYAVIAELPGVESSAVQWSVCDGQRVVIRAESPERKYHKELVLPGLVNEQAAVSCYSNGVLELHLWKV